jgi:hypothetical protein
VQLKFLEPFPFCKSKIFKRMVFMSKEALQKKHKVLGLIKKFLDLKSMDPTVKLLVKIESEIPQKNLEEFEITSINLLKQIQNRKLATRNNLSDLLSDFSDLEKVKAYYQGFHKKLALTFLDMHGIKESEVLFGNYVGGSVVSLDINDIKQVFKSELSLILVTEGKKLRVPEDEYKFSDQDKLKNSKDALREIVEIAKTNFRNTIISSANDNIMPGLLSMYYRGLFGIFNLKNFAQTRLSFALKDNFKSKSKLSKIMLLNEQEEEKFKSVPAKVETSSEVMIKIALERIEALLPSLDQYDLDVLQVLKLQMYTFGGKYSQELILNELYRPLLANIGITKIENLTVNLSRKYARLGKKLEKLDPEIGMI